MKWLCIFLLLCTPLAAANQKPKKPNLTSINIVDRNGFSETISLKDRLEQFEKVNFFQPQPYQKVMRTYERDQKGNIPSFLTSYYPNGQVKQYLEIVNSRASGLYQEWYPYGQKKLAAKVIGGQAELEEGAQASWMFDGPTLAYGEDGKIQARILYNKGVLEGKSEQFYPSGELKNSTHYKAGVPDGEFVEKYPDGKPSRVATFSLGLPHGAYLTYWPDGSLAGEEHFENGQLLVGTYHLKNPTKEHEELYVIDGMGKRMTLEEGVLKEIIEIRDGLPYGKVWLYTNTGRLDSVRHVKYGKKEGEEIIYYPTGKRKIAMEWHDDYIHGIVKTYYSNGVQMSQNEMAKNKKQGLSTAWYPSGDLMFIEEYENDLIISGRYFKKGEQSPISTIEKGTGLATLYDPDGTFGTKVHYENGLPLK